MRRGVGLWLVLVLGLSGCGEVHAPRSGGGAGPSSDAAARPDARPPPAGAQTAEGFDTTTMAERQAAATAPPARERMLGRSVATLGDPSTPGFWASTPLVDRIRPGRLTYRGSGKSVLVELRPRDAAPGAGTQVSLAAMRVLGVPLTALVEVTVHIRAP